MNKIVSRVSVGYNIRTFEPVKQDEKDINKTNWRNIIFLPHHFYWEIWIQINILINIVIILFKFIELGEGNTPLNVVYYFLEVSYAADTLLSIMHRQMFNHRKRRLFRARNAIMIIIDVITLIPYWELYSIIYWKGEQYHKIDTYSRIKCFLRCIRLGIFYQTKRNQVGFNQLSLISVCHFFMLSMITLALSIIFIKIGGSKGLNWTSTLQYHKIKKSDKEQIFVVAYTTISSLLAHHWIGRVRGQSSSGRIVVILAMFFGFLLHMMIFNGQLTAIYLKVFRKQYDYTKRLNLVKTFFKEWTISEHDVKRTKLYYSELWEKRRGIRYMPESFNLLPLSLRKEVCIDIFWEAIRHSHLFIGMDMSFKRELALVMNNECLLTGDYLFKIGELNHRMVFIESGVVEVLSMEDDDSPILSFSSGTVLGEMSCLVPSLSKCNIRCATYCELYTVKLADVYKILLKYRDRTAILQAHLKDRLQNARVMMQTRRVLGRMIEISPYETPIKRLKKQWRDLFHMKHKGKRGPQSVKSANSYICSEYLDLLVLSDRSDLKLNAICLRGKWPCVMHPDSNFRRFLMYCCLFAVVYECLVLPRHVAQFGKTIITPVSMGLFLLFDIIYLMDIYLQSVTAFKSRDTLIEDASKIIIARFKQLSFLIDIISSIPFDYIGQFVEMTDHKRMMFRLPKLLKIYKILYYIVTKEHTTHKKIGLIRLIKFFVIYFMVVYFLCALVGMMACFNLQCSEYGWLRHGKKLLTHDVDLSKANDKLIISVHYALSLIISVANNSFAPYGFKDMCVYVMAAHVGYTLGQMTATYVNHLESKHQYNEIIRMMRTYFIVGGVPAYLRMRAISMYTFNFLYNENAIAWGDDNIFKDTPEIMEVVRRRLISYLELVPLFCNLSDDLLTRITNIAELTIYPANTDICFTNNKSIWVYIIIRGVCRMQSSVPGDTDRGTEKLLTSGDAFPIIEVLHQVNSFISVTTLTAVEAITLPCVELLKVLYSNRLENSAITNALVGHREQFRNILNRLPGRLERQVDEQIGTGIRAYGKGSYFTYEMWDDEEENVVQQTVRPKSDYLNPFKKIGLVGIFLRYVLLPKTISPYGKFYTVWEFVRCTIAFAETCLVLMQFNFLLVYHKEVIYFDHFCFASCLVDFYVRMHCQYYSSKGILITHPLRTTVRYFKTSFVIDFIGAFPMQYTNMGISMLGSSHFQKSKLLMLARILQMHRVISLFSYHADVQSGSKSFLLRTFRAVLIIAIIVGICANILLLVTCTLVEKNVNFECHVIASNETRWLRDFRFIRHSNNELAVAVFYSIMSTFTGSLCGLGVPNSTVEAYYIVPGMILLYILKTIFLVLTAAMQVGGNAAITKNLFKIKHFLKYAKIEPIDETLINEIVKYSEYKWKKAGGTDFIISMHKLNENLLLDIRVQTFSDALTNSYFFHMVDESFLQTFCYHLRNRAFKKDSEIIRCNDITDRLYFILKGKVEVTIAGTKVALLGKGCCFGCMNKFGSTRHTITVTAKVHVDLLTINSSKFNEIVAENSVVANRLYMLQSFQYEYIHSKQVKEKKRVQCVDTESNLKVASKQYNKKIESYADCYRKVNYLIKQDSTWFLTCNYIMNVHLAPMSVLSILFVSFSQYENSHAVIIACYVMWIIDLIFWVRVVINFHLSYVDPESGITIISPGKIKKRYVSSYRFWLDVIANFPAELLLYYCGVSKDYLKYVVLLRGFRCFYLVEYYYACKSSLSVSSVLRGTLLLYTIIIQLSGMSLMWWYIACPHGVCKYLKISGFTFQNVVFENTTDTTQALLLSFTYTINLFTATGLRDMIPTSLTEVVVSTLISLVAMISISLFCAAFTNMLVLNSVTFCDYEYRIEQLRTYLRYRELSPIIMDKVWWYLLELWSLRQGGHLPSLMDEVPRYLKEDLMTAAYGIYLENHFLFGKTHKDFLRQLVVHFHRVVYLPGYSIVEKGDIDGCLYFIHRGEVEEFEKHGSTEIITGLFTNGMSFGEIQGLFEVPYENSYRALSLVDLISLRKRDWIYLLKWFPASHEELLERIARYRLVKETSKFVSFDKLIY